MKQNVEIMAYIYSDVGGTLRAMRFLDGIRIVRSSETMFDIESTETTLPEQFFSANVAHVAAIVGSNSSGKSTALQDICRVLAGKTPITATYAVVMRSDQGVYQISNCPGLVKLDGRDIPDENPKRNANLKVVFYAGGYDPFGRTQELAPRSTGIEFCDISDQFIYSSAPLSDFPYKLAYLESLIHNGDPSLYLQADGTRNRTISFVATAGYDFNTAARDILEFTLTFSNDSAHSELLLKLLQITPSDLTADLYDAIDTKRILNEKGTHFLEEELNYFEILRIYVDSITSNETHIYPLAFALAIGKLAELLHAEPHSANLKKQLQRIHIDFKGVVENLFGASFYSDMMLLHFAARNAAANALADDGLSINITLGGRSPKNGFIRGLIKVLLRLRYQGFDFAFHFSGISEGQRTLLTLYSRLFMQLTAIPHTGNTLLMIDEYEHGLHPEWQRRFLQELITLLARDGFASVRYQIILSTHSPFLVSDLPGTHVNRVGDDIQNPPSTLAANLLELLLSPLFLENSTGEFSRKKITKLLDEVERAENTESLDTASMLLPLLGDDLVRNYCALRVREKERTLEGKRA